MLSTYSRSEIEDRPLLLRTMHEDRKRVFVDTLKWDLKHDGSQEHDDFDRIDATYLVSSDIEGKHLCSVRLLDTESTHLLGTVFPQLCESGVPRASDVKEITRYIASPRLRASERQRARNMVCRALIEYGLLHGIRMYTAICEMSFLTQMLAAGWRCDPLGLPQRIDGSIIGAFCIHVEPEAIDKMVQGWRWPTPALEGFFPQQTAA